jgi:uncharacterized BrkB/YihY/UPF0761 family membrane protein
MEKREEFLLLLLVIAIILILGITALIIVSTTDLGSSGLTEEGNPMGEVIEHASNWIMWLIFGIALIVGIILYMYFINQKK